MLKFKSSYILRVFEGDYNPFTPNIIRINDDSVEFRRRNWHLISVDSEELMLNKVTGVTIDKHIFGATIKIKSTGSDSIVAFGFGKGKANKIKSIINEKTH